MRHQVPVGVRDDQAAVRHQERVAVVRGLVGDDAFVERIQHQVHAGDADRPAVDDDGHAGARHQRAARVRLDVGLQEAFPAGLHRDRVVVLVRIVGEGAGAGGEIDAAVQALRVGHEGAVGGVAGLARELGVPPVEEAGLHLEPGAVEERIRLEHRLHATRHRRPFDDGLTRRAAFELAGQDARRAHRRGQVRAEIGRHGLGDPGRLVEGLVARDGPHAHGQEDQHRQDDHDRHAPEQGERPGLQAKTGQQGGYLRTGATDLPGHDRPEPQISLAGGRAGP